MADHFTYRVSWSGDDGEFVGTCLEFPSLSHLAGDQEAALRGVRALVADVFAEMRANNEPTPEPLADTHYSGKFMTRIPPEQHRRLVIEAAEKRISLNRLVSMRLAMPDVLTFRAGAVAYKARAPKRSAKRRQPAGKHAPPR